MKRDSVSFDAMVRLLDLGGVGVLSGDVTAILKSDQEALSEALAAATGDDVDHIRSMSPVQRAKLFADIVKENPRFFADYVSYVTAVADAVAAVSKAMMDVGGSQ